MAITIDAVRKACGKDRVKAVELLDKMVSIGEIDAAGKAGILSAWDANGSASGNGNGAAKVPTTKLVAPAARYTQDQILADLVAQRITQDEASKRLSEVSAVRGGLSCKVSGKGAVSLYGMGKFPVTLYVEQWERMFAFREQIEGFIAAHDSELKRKGETDE